MKIFNKTAMIVSVLTFMVLGICSLLLDLPILSSFKDAFSDFSLTDNGLVQVRKGQYKVADTNIALINTKGLNLKGIKALVQIISDYSPKVIAVNYNGYSNEENYHQITNELITNPAVVLGCRIADFTKKSDNIYYSNIGSGDSNHIVREFSPFYKTESRIYKSFYSRIVEKYNNKLYANLVNRNNPKEVINFRGNYTQFFFLEAEDIFSNQYDPSIISGKILILGNCSVNEDFKELNDYYFTPLNDEPMGRSMPDMYLPEIQANIVSMLIDNNYIFVVPNWANYLIAFLLIYLNFTTFLYIIEKKESLYELLSLIIFLVESFILLLLDVQFFREYNIESGLTVSLLTLAIGLLMFEVYTESILPIYLLFKSKRSRN